VNLTGTGTFDITAGGNQTIGTLAGVAGSSVALGGNTLTLGAATDTAFDGSIGGTGGLVKNGAGTLELGAANTFTGGVTLNAGGLSVGNDAALGTGALTVAGASSLNTSAATTLANDIALNAALTLPVSNDLTLDGAISGTSGLVKNGAATLALNGNNTFSGGTTVGGGTLVVGSNTALGTGGLSIDGATLQAGAAVTLGNDVTVGGSGVTVQGPDDLTLNGSVSGTGGLDKEGTGTLSLGGSLAGLTGDLTVNGGILNASNPYTGGISVGASGTLNLDGSGNAVTVNGPIGGTVNVGGGSDINIAYGALPGVTGTVNGTATGSTLNITGSGDASLPGGVFNDITNLNVGAGTLSVDSGTSVAFTGGSTIGGTLVVNGDLGGPATINSGGGLVGGGTITGPVTVNGTVAPSGITGATGAAAGTGTAGSVLTVGGLTLGAGSTTQVRTTAGGANDSITVNGGAALGGQLVATPSAGTYAPTTNYTIVNASGGITGAYAGVSQTTLPFLDASVTQQGNQLILTLSQAGSGTGTGGTPFDQFPGLNGNQQSMAAALQHIATSGGNPLPTLLSYVRGLRADQAVKAFDSLTGETYASAANAELSGQSQYQDSLFYRLKLQRDTGEQGPAVWAEPYTSSSDFDGSSDVAHTDYRIRGVIIGADAPLTPDLRLGVHANVANSRTEVNRRGDYTDVDQASIGLHALYFNQQQWWVEGLASYGWQNADSSRHIVVGPFDPQASGKYDGKTINAALEGGYRFDLGKAMHLEPFVGAYYSKVKYDSFTEKNAGDADLRVGRTDASSLQYGVGARLVGDVDLGVEGTRLHPILLVRYLHNTKGDTISVNNAFAGAPSDTFTVDGSRPVRNHWQAGVGVSFDITPKFSTYVYYNTDVASHTTSNAVNLGVRWNF
jgi:autotransporter-associated beta strand protein